MKRIFTTLMILMIMNSVDAMAEEGCSKSQIRKAVVAQMTTYPQSTLKDLYKSFFQDEFGPGHLLKDTAAAGNYLRSELASYNIPSGPNAEPTGCKGNFVRVNLSVIKSGAVPYDLFFDAFVRSVSGIHPITVAAWAKEWGKIFAVIRERYPDLPEMARDEAEIEARFAEGKYQGDHSEIYEKTYDPHYRIMSRKIYQKEIEPLIKSR